jgi:acyl transferase domain-containing protein/NAD(P)-dependent dehydrogenase (short-subunit alcohol dehydrogenase family)/acyl carrier protein
MSVAVVGIGCRFPGGVTDAAGFWQLLNAGVDAVTEIPPSRIDLSRYYDARPATRGRMMTRWGGFLDGIEDFDAGFFGISPREAERLDPQQRLLLETAWEALEDAGQDIHQLEGTRTGVFVGQWLSDFEARLFAKPDNVDFHMTTGSGRYAASGRVSYAFGLRGPSLTLDTACSSSLVAIHLAAQSVWRGESQMAIAGGANIILQPHISIAYSQSRMMSADGRCKFGDARGDGYVRSEGVGVVVLKSLDRALADGDRIYAVIRGGAVNNDGRSGGSLGTPSREGQEDLLRDAYGDAGRGTGEVGYIEAHGTGTRVGDPVELGALGAVLREGRPPGSKVRVGSIKTNFGHTEGAAGVAGFIKVALALYHRRIPASLNCSQPTPAIDWKDTPCEIASEARPWLGERRLGGVSAFGITGTNAHIVLEGAPWSSPISSSAPALQRPFLLPLSARSWEALRALAKSYGERLSSPNSKPLRDVCATASLHRTPLDCRAVFVAQSRAEFVDRLARFATGEQGAAQAYGRITNPKDRRIAFVFPGQGAQWRGMARELLGEEPAFRASIERSEIALRAHVPWSLIAKLLEQEDAQGFSLNDISVIQPVLLAVEIALADLWRSRGIEPDAIVGHSMGEVGAAYIAGVLSLDEAVAIICRRSALMEQTSGNGAMAVVELSMLEATTRLAHHVGRASVAVNNGPRSSVISGDRSTIESVVAELEHDGVFARLVRVDVASHSVQMDPLVPDLVASQSSIVPRPAGIPLYSTVEARRVDGTELGANYWGRNLRQSVLFGQTVSAMLADGVDTFIELGPHPTLLGAIKEIAKENGREVLALQSLRREEPERLQLLFTLGELFVGGYAVDWRRMFPDGYLRVDLPHYPWQRERHWLADPAAAVTLGVASREGLLGEPVSSSTQPDTYFWEVEAGAAAFPYLADHKVEGIVVFPAAGFLEIAIEAASWIFGRGRAQISEVTLDNALVLPDNGACALQIAVEPGPLGSLIFTISSKDKGEGGGGKWISHARGAIAQGLSERVADELPNGLQEDAIPVDADAHYSAMHSRGLEYGIAFRGVRELRKMQGKIVGRVALPKDLQGAGYAIHPALLDACLQVGLGLLPEDAEGGAIVPVAIERIQLISDIDSSSPLTVRGSCEPEISGEHALRTDLRIEDAAGCVLLRIDGLAFARLERNARRADEGLYSVAWKAKPLVAARSESPATWSVLADRRGAGATLGQLLGPLHRENLEFCGADNLRVGLEEFMRRAETDGTPAQGVVHLWSLDALPPDARGGSLAAARDLGCLSALALVQVAASLSSVRRRRLCLVTAGAQAVLHGEVPAIEQAPLWGLGRVIANEHPELACTLIDLSSSPSLQEIDALARELNAETDDDQIAIRGEERFVARLLPTQLADVAHATLRPAVDRPYRVHIDTPGILDGLVLRSNNRPGPGISEVEIEIESTGLNFMNVLSALGACPGHPNGVGPLGIECAGSVTAVGDSVGDLRVGDRVMAIVFDSLASHCIADARLVRKMPAEMSFTEASSIPVAFLTAHYALNSLARIESGDRVLIHAATGGVGLAALQLARLAGAEVFATASTEEKRALLERMGVAHVMNSRSLAFRAEIMERTGGKGVDVVLNSLAGDFIPASLAVLAPYGRFVELGKVDIYRNSRINLSPFQKSLSFFAVDLDRMIRDRPANVAKIFDEVMRFVRSGAIRPLPTTSFPVSQVDVAFRLMAKAGHIGKIVISSRDPEARIVEARDNPFGEAVAGTCVITGGLGGLGLAFARRWVERGGRSIALIGRTIDGTAQGGVLRTLESAGASVRLFAVDVTAAEQLRAAFADIEATMPEISTVVHAAGILEDGIILQQDAASFTRAMAPKVEGAWNVYNVIEDAPDINLILFSSVTSLLGLPGQSNYAAGNAFLDSLSAYRRAKGGRATVINWGPWKDIGLAAEQVIRGGRLASGGLNSLDPAQALDELERILVHSPSQTVAMDMDWRAFSASNFRSARSPFLSDVSPARPADAGAPPEARASDIFTAAAAGTPRRAAIELFLKEQVARVLRQATGRIDAAKPFRSLGLDSLMGLELRNRLEVELSLQLPASVVWNYPTVKALAPHLASLLGIPIDAPRSNEVVATPASSAEEIDSLLYEIENLAGDEVRRLLELDETPGLSK